MEQLSNMPIWAQILSLGSFMFASGVLMTRVPLVPAVILSFFYLYGAFGDSSAMPSFTLKHPWMWTALPLVLLVLLAFLWIGFNSALSRSSGPDSMGLGFAGVWLIILTVGVVGIAILVSIFPALFKWVKFLSAVSHSPWQLILWSTLFMGGIVIGIFSLGGIETLRNMLEGQISGMLLSRFVFIALIATMICICSLSSITFGMNHPAGILFCCLSICCTAILISNGTSQAKYQYLHSNSQQALLAAAENGDLEQTKQLLVKGLNVNARNRSQSTPLLEASSSEHLEVVQELIKAGANVNVADKFGTTPLSIAAFRGNLPIVKELLKAGANINVITDEGSPLVGAIHRGYFDVAIALIEAGADVNIESRYPYRSALAEASWQDGNIELVKLLLQKEANVNQTDFEGKTPLQLTLGRKNSEQASRLIYAAGGRLGKISSDDQTEPMMDHACGNGFTEVVDQLLQAGVKPTPHHAIIAAQDGQTEVLKQLKAAGLDIHQPNDKGNHPFLSAVGLGHLDTVKFFVENGADLTLRDGNAGPALLLASLEGYLPIVKYLIEQKAAVDIQNQFGETPLMMAAAKDHTAVALFLLEHGANVNKQKKVGTTALKYAAGRGNIPLIQALLKAGADINLADEDNDTPLIEACFEGHKEAVQELLKAGAKTNIRDKEGKTALGIALEKGHTEVVKLLQSAGAKE